MNLSFHDIRFRYDPYPLGLAKSVLPAPDYTEMVENWPAHDLFFFVSQQGRKYSLSELYHPREYRAFVRSHRVWREFRRMVKSRQFVEQILTMLCDHNIDLGLGLCSEGVSAGLSGTRVWKQRAKAALARFRLHISPGTRLKTRFEFSMMPADGGCILPHTDNARKVITLVLPILHEGEWNPDFGGGTAVVRPRDITRNFNYVDRYLNFDEVETLSTLPFEPNQCVVFIKTFNSWHAVHPMRGTGSGAMRKTLTVNVVKGG